MSNQQVWIVKDIAGRVLLTERSYEGAWAVFKSSHPGMTIKERNNRGYTCEQVYPVELLTRQQVANSFLREVMQKLEADRRWPENFDSADLHREIARVVFRVAEEIDTSYPNGAWTMNCGPHEGE